MTIIAIGFYGPKVSELNKAFKNIEKKQAICYILLLLFQCWSLYVDIFDSYYSRQHQIVSCCEGYSPDVACVFTNTVLGYKECKHLQLL